MHRLLRITATSLVSLVLCRAAEAQQGAPPAPAPAPAPAVNEPRLPANATSPTDYPAGPNTAGMPQPGDRAATPATAAPGPTGVSGDGGYSGSDMDVDGGNAKYYGGGGVQRRVPKTHQVRKGDTLWTICNHYYGDPWSWPQVWAYNKNITNPHWIYPGDEVRLLSGPAVAPRAERAERLRVRSNGRQADDAIQLRQNAFVEPRELDRSGHIAGSREERLLLSTNDEVYVQGNDRFDLQEGQSYTVYRLGKRLRDSQGKKLGHIVQIHGTVRVKAYNKKTRIATCLITESLNPIERHYRVGPLRRRFVRLPVQPADRDLESEIIASFMPTKNHASEELVFLGRGRNQGVREGNRFLVVRRGDGYSRLLQDIDEKVNFPRETVAEVTVLDVRDDCSIGLVTRATKEIRVGDRIQLRKGY